MAVRLDQGTKEFVNYLVTDTTGAVTDLTGTTPKFDVVEDDGVTFKITAQNCLLGSDKMLLQCLIDTALGGLWAKQHYNVFVYWTIGSETPREGPFDLFVI